MGSMFTAQNDFFKLSYLNLNKIFIFCSFENTLTKLVPLERYQLIQENSSKNFTCYGNQSILQKSGLSSHLYWRYSCKRDNYNISQNSFNFTFFQTRSEQLYCAQYFISIPSHFWWYHTASFLGADLLFFLFPC